SIAEKIPEAKPEVKEVAKQLPKPSEIKELAKEEPKRPVAKEAPKADKVTPKAEKCRKLVPGSRATIETDCEDETPAATATPKAPEPKPRKPELEARDETAPKPRPTSVVHRDRDGQLPSVCLDILRRGLEGKVRPEDVATLRKGCQNI